MPADAEPRPVGHLGPHAVGSRVVVRRLVPGETGPTGGPAFADVLGILERWDTSVAVRTATGDLVTFATSLVVSGKPVPPRPSRFSRLSPDVVLRYAEGGFRRLESEPLGDWELRYAGGANPRANAALAVGDPGVPLTQALLRVEDFSAAHDREPVIEVVAGSSWDQQLTALGWQPLGSPGDVLVAGIAALGRQVAGLDTSEVQHQDLLTRDWLVGNDRALANFDAVAANLHLPDIVFASLDDDAGQLGHVRANLVGDWAFVADLMAAERARRRGMGRTLMADMIRWAAERGATAMVLDTAPDNDPAQALYRSLGFQHHCSFRLLQAPSA